MSRLHLNKVGGPAFGKIWVGRIWIGSLHYITLSLFHTPFTPKVTSGASTKLFASVNRWVFSCLLKVHVSVSSWRAKGSKRKIIPCFRSGMREASFAELALQYWKFISERVRRSESSSAGQISGCRYNVRQVGRSTANMHQTHKYAQFERYAKLNWEPIGGSAPGKIWVGRIWIGSVVQLLA